MALNLQTFSESQLEHLLWQHCLIPEPTQKSSAQKLVPNGGTLKGLQGELMSLSKAFERTSVKKGDQLFSPVEGEW